MAKFAKFRISQIWWPEEEKKMIIFLPKNNEMNAISSISYQMEMVRSNFVILRIASV